MTQRERDELALALCVAMEARGEPLEGQIAVAWSVLNRVRKPRWWGSTVIGVITKTGQYDGYAVAMRRGMLDALADVSEQHLWVARGVLNGWLSDPTKGATHYLNPRAVARIPDWTRTLPKVMKIGNHDFYVEA